MHWSQPVWSACHPHHPYAKGKSVKCSSSTKPFWSFTTKQHISILLNNGKSCRLVFKCKRKQHKHIKWFHYSLSTVIQDTRSPEISNWHNSLQSGCVLMPLATSYSEDFGLKGVNNIFSNQFGISGFPRDLNYAREPVWSHFRLFFFSMLKQVPIFFICLGECWKAVLFWSAREILWTKRLYRTFHWHGGESKTTESL